MKIEEIVSTINAIIQSPLVEQYKMGISMRSPNRRKQYLGVGFEHYVIIDTWLSANEALEKEQETFRLLTKDVDQRSLLYRKYDHKSRDTNTPQSLGGHKPEPEEKYDLYIAWWSP